METSENVLTQNNMAKEPARVFLFSGKRKSGKDYCVEKISTILGKDICDVIRLSGPLKKQYAVEHWLNYEKLLDSSSYKETYRKAMIEWGEAKRAADPGFFCRLATDSACKPVWIVSDARRRTDLEYFRGKFQTVHVRVEASQETRKGRGWEFIPGIDDAESECDLDSENADVIIKNDGDWKVLENSLQELKNIAKSALMEIWNRARLNFIISELQIWKDFISLKMEI